MWFFAYDRFTFLWLMDRLNIGFSYLCNTSMMKKILKIVMFSFVFVVFVISYETGRTALTRFIIVDENSVLCVVELNKPGKIFTTGENGVKEIKSEQKRKVTITFDSNVSVIFRSGECISL